MGKKYTYILPNKRMSKNRLVTDGDIKKGGTLTLKEMKRLYKLSKIFTTKISGEDIVSQKVPLYYGNKYIGQVDLISGKKTVWPYENDKGLIRNIYWNKKLDKWGHFFYKVYFYNK